MNVWLVTIGEPVPTTGKFNERLHRTGYFAKFLSESGGHRVIWWSSTFNHFKKEHLFNKDRDVIINNKLQIKLLYGGGYQSNVSLARIKDHRTISAKFADAARKMPEKPDIIVCALPSISLCSEAVKYGREMKIPVVLDMRDMWPDIFADAIPKPLRVAARPLLMPMYMVSKRACHKSTAIIGITDEFVAWGLKRGKRAATAQDKSFPLGYMSDHVDDDRLAEAEQKWDAMFPDENYIACYIGTIARWGDFETIIRAAKVVLDKEASIKFAICGAGDTLEMYKTMARDLPNIVFPGWINAAEIYSLMRRSAIGIDPLPDRYDFLSTINNKAIEYMSAGLPVISCPRRGVLHNLVTQQQCGVSYEYGDAEGLASIILDLFHDRDKLGMLSKNAMSVFDKEFRAENVYGNLAEHLQFIINTYKTI